MNRRRKYLQQRDGDGQQGAIDNAGTAARRAAVHECGVVDEEPAAIREVTPVRNAAQGQEAINVTADRDGG